MHNKSNSEKLKTVYTLGVKNLPAIQEMQEIQVIPGSGRSPGEGNGKPLQYVSLKNAMDRGAWRAAIQRFAKSRA